MLSPQKTHRLMLRRLCPLREALALVLILALIPALSVASATAAHPQTRRQRSAALVSRAGVKPSRLPQKLIDAPFIDQRESYPTGCESVAAVMALRHAGVDMTVDDFIDGYLPRGKAPGLAGDSEIGGDPWQVFLGDPRSEQGWGCYAPVIEGALKGALANTDLTPRVLYDQSLDSLCRDYIDRGIPLLLWVTIDMARPVSSTRWTAEESGRDITWVYPLHCMLLVGYDSEGYYFNDPLRGKQLWYPANETRRAYEGTHSQALALTTL